MSTAHSALKGKARSYSFLRNDDTTQKGAFRVPKPDERIALQQSHTPLYTLDGGDFGDAPNLKPSA